MHIKLPTTLTLLRIAAIPAFVALFFVAGDTARWAALALFILAAITDWLDGYLARALNLHSALGEMLDPIADKLIVAAALLMLTWDGTIRGLAIIPALVILAREILVSGLREYLGHAQVKVRVSRTAKFKTAIQMIAICILLGAKPVEPVFPLIDQIGAAGLWAAAVMTVYTGWSYFIASLHYIERQSR